MAEYEQQHAEQQQWTHELPDVAEDRAKETQLEFVARDRERKVPEAPPVVGQRSRPPYRLPDAAWRGHAREHLVLGQRSQRRRAGRLRDHDTASLLVGLSSGVARSCAPAPWSSSQLSLCTGMSIAPPVLRALIDTNENLR